MDKLLKKTNIIIEANKTFEIVYGCSGSKILINNMFFMEDTPTDKKDKYICLYKEFLSAPVYFNFKILKSFVEMIEHPIDFKRKELEKKVAINKIIPKASIETIDLVYDLILKSCRRYNSASIFDIAKVDPGSSKTNRYILFSELAKYFGLSKVVPIVKNAVLFLNNKELRGCIIEKINGIDISNWNSLDSIDKTAMENLIMTDECCANITSLHILDYLSGQVDRNLSNMIYICNDVGNISRCVAIDNDVCFGCSTAKDLLNTKLGDINNISHIDINFFNRIMHVDERKIKKILDFYLDPREINCFFIRLSELKECLIRAIKVNPGNWNNYKYWVYNNPYVVNIRNGIKEIDID